MPGRGAAAVIFDEDGRILLVKENYDRRRYGLPGGAVEPGETPEDAALRETREETGLEVAVDYLVGRYQLEKNGLMVHTFRCRIVSGTPTVPQSGEIAEVGWFSVADLPAPLTSILHHSLPDALAGKRDVARLGLRRLN